MALGLLIFMIKIMFVPHFDKKQDELPKTQLDYHFELVASVCLGLCCG